MVGNRVDLVVEPEVVFHEILNIVEMRSSFFGAEAHPPYGPGCNCSMRDPRSRSPVVCEKIWARSGVREAENIKNILL